MLPVADGFTTERGLRLGAVESNAVARFMQEHIGLWPYAVLILGPVFAVAGMLALWSLPWPTSRVLKALCAVGCWVSLGTYWQTIQSNLSVIASLSG